MTVLPAQFRVSYPVSRTTAEPRESRTFDDAEEAERLIEFLVWRKASGIAFETRANRVSLPTLNRPKAKTRLSSGRC